MTIQPLSIRDQLADRSFLLFGATGFLGKVWLVMLLYHFPEVKQIYMIVRERKHKDGRIKQSSEERFWADVASSKALDPLRKKYPGAAFEDFLRSKITPIPGDVSHPFAGVSDERRAEMRGQLDALINSSGVVDFNPPLDEGLKVNAYGMQNLVALAKDLGDLPFFHVSTCYVAGDRTGEVFEVHPSDHPFPKAEKLDTSLWDPTVEIAECQDLIEDVRHRSKDAFRQTAFLDQAKAKLKARNEPERGSALESEFSKVKRDFESKRLVDAGMERATFWGWHNIYTYTKSIGEQILCASGLRFTIGRPAVIESSVSFPLPGWNEGINTSAPLIYLGLKIPIQYPAEKDTVLDVIPVDHVAAGMMFSLAELLEGTAPAVYQYGSSDTNPLAILRLIELVGLYKRRYYQNKGGNALTNWLNSHLEPSWLPAQAYYKKGVRSQSQRIKQLSDSIGSLGGPLRPLTSPISSGLKDVARSLEGAATIADMFVPFMATHNYRFSCANTRRAFGRLSEEERAMLPWEPEKIDWHSYILDVHGPTVAEYALPKLEERINKPKKALRRHDTLLDYLDELRDRHDRVPALLKAHDDGFRVMSYRDLHHCTEATATRLVQLGIRPGDRVGLGGQNDPSWVVAYFGILRAGGVVVPLDPAYSPEQAYTVSTAGGLKGALLDQKAVLEFGTGLECPTYDLQEITVRGEVADLPELDLSPENVASILYTSGTTGQPKGVMLTHENFTSMIASLGRIFSLRSSDRVLSILPLHHTFEFSCGLLLPLSMGARVIYLDEINGERLTYGLQEGKVTAMVGVPALWQLLERRIRGQIRERGEIFELGVDAGLELNRILGRQTGLDIGRLFFGAVHQKLGGRIRILISGGAALPKETYELFSGLGLHLAEGYGLTEAAPVLTVAQGRPGARHGDVGKPIPGVEVRIHEPDAQGIGEVWAKGPNVMKGYYQNDLATRSTVDGDGWLHTGDLGRIDHKGRLVLMGRAKEVVVTPSGENIYLDDVENTLGSISYVKEYSLVGIDNPRGGERLGMLAVPDSEGSLDRATRRARARDAIRDAVQKLTMVNRPAVIHLVDADLPRTATRKVKRKEVRKTLQRIAQADSLKSQPDKSSEFVSHPVLQAIATVAGVSLEKVRPQVELQGELGFDSLMWVELAAALESTHGRPGPEALSACLTVSEVIELTRSEPPAVQEEEDYRETVSIPELVAEPLRNSLGWAQRQIYDAGLKTRVYGRANIPQNRPTIVVSNHCSHLDMGLVKFALGPYGRKLVALAAKDYFFEGNKWWVAYFEQLTNLQPLDRNAGFRASLMQAKQVVQDGHIVLLFPEGTRRTDGTIAEFKPLMGKLALETGVDVLPLHLGGTFDVLPKGTILPRGRSVTVRIGPPLEIGELRRLTEGLSPAEAAREVASLAQRSVEALREGSVLNLSSISSLQDQTDEAPQDIHQAMLGLPERLPEDDSSGERSWYFSLGETKYTVLLKEGSCQVSPGRPPGGKAECVVKTSEQMMTRIITEAYVPSPEEFISGTIKTSDIPKLIEFCRIFKLSEVSL